MTAICKYCKIIGCTFIHDGHCCLCWIKYQSEGGDPYQCETCLVGKESGQQSLMDNPCTWSESGECWGQTCACMDEEKGI